GGGEKKKEWSTHGTCWDKTPNAFFEQALQWHSAYDIPTILRNNNFQQEVKYSKTDIENALTKNMWGTQVQVTCSSGGEYIDQFLACFDWSGKPLNCPTPQSSVCGSTVILSS
ncbi:hypothetical protein RFI_11790, partial [Reticulomyxa filosa]